MESSTTHLTLQERVRTALELGESHFREFKSAQAGPPNQKQPRSPKEIRKDIGEALVAFANADGGELVVGVEDDGRVTGVTHDQQDIESFLEAWKTHVHPETPLPPPVISQIDLDGELVLYFSVSKSVTLIHLTNDGRCMQRRDRDSVPVPTNQIIFERQEQVSREYDRTFLDGGDPSALDLEAVERMGESIAPGLSPEKILQLLDLAEFSGPGMRLRRAAALLLARDIKHWHPRCEVRILRVAGTELMTGRDYNVDSDTHVVGSILELLTKAWEELRPFLVETRLGLDGRFEEQVRYPEDACREALTNAIAHRDYSIEGRAIEVYVFDDRLEIRSPGALLSTVTIEGIKSLSGLHQSRNTTISRTLRELGYMREMGEGFRRIFQLMRAHDLVEPDLVADDQSFVVSLRHRSVFSEEDRRWIEAYDRFALERSEEKVMLLGRTGGPLSVQQIMDALDLVDTEDYRLLIDGLLQKGLIVSVLRRSARRRNRNSPRWKIVQPKDANEYMADLLRATQAAYRNQPFGKAEHEEIFHSIGEGSPYKVSRIQPILRRLGLTDVLGNPTGHLQAILETNTMGGDAPVPQPASTATATSGASTEAEVGAETSSEGRPGDGAEDVLPEGDAEDQAGTLFIGNLAYTTDEASLRALFERIGAVRNVTLPPAINAAGKNRGYGFVEMNVLQEAKKAKEALQGSLVDGRALFLDWARSKVD
jgi:ATP-dependent DNA helicase RecG